MSYVGARPNAVPSIALRDITQAEFDARHYAAQQPVVIRNSIPDWRANNWGREYFRAYPGNPLVKMMHNGTGVFNPVAEDRALGKPKRFYMRWTHASDLIYSERGRNHYVSQLPIDTTLPALEGDIGRPLLLDDTKSIVDRNLWFGGVGCKTPLHFDPTDNFLVQIKGVKKVTLFAPEQTANLYPASTTRMPHVSRVNSFDPDFEKFPQCRAAYANRLETEIGPGDTLYLPPKWWHAVETVETSLSVNYWWDDGSIAKAPVTLRDRLISAAFKSRDLYLLADWLLFRRV